MNKSAAVASVSFVHEACKSTNDLPHSNDPASVISQDKYDQLVSLLQQANMIPSTINDIGSRSNQVTLFA